VILHGDCREQLRTLEDCSVDSIVTDPPYELGFMGKKWDASGIAYDPTVWAECLRVLKPGGHLLAFGGTRTYHRMTVAIEDAGFEIRDSLHWLYGSGFPKSLDVSKAIDKAAGATRKVMGTRRGAVKGTEGRYNWNTDVHDTGPTIVHDTAPATDAARVWDGWGTALKPAHEPIVLARKPLVGTVAANVLEYGTGALNIDATRIAAVDTIATVTGRGTLGGTSDGYDRPWKRDPEAVARREERAAVAIEKANTIGRWPANLILTHSPECQQTGTGTSRIVDKERGRRPGSANLGNIGGAKGDPMPNGPTYDDTPERWDCAPGCPVAALNTQSGNSTSPPVGSVSHTNASTSNSMGSKRNARPIPNGHGDAGGASRFFTTTEWDPEYDAPFLYVAKPSRRERNAGLDDTNGHPTVKPVALMRHLVRLVTPPGGTVLDPFLGSGTTAVAASLEGFQWIGCELTDDYLPIIQARVTWAEQHQPEPDLTLFTDAE
jgi:site-specific DNA-methyltransferase (adenine-specific)